MAEIRFQTRKGEDEIINEVCKKMGWKRADLGRQAVLEYLKSLSVIARKIKQNEEVKK